jgi:hypothetical protein
MRHHDFPPDLSIRGFASPHHTTVLFTTHACDVPLALPGSGVVINGAQQPVPAFLFPEYLEDHLSVFTCTTVPPVYRYEIQ